MLEVETIVYCSSNSEPFLVQFKKENSILKAIDPFELENKTSGGNYSVENSTIEGNVQTEKRYPGCPFCENPAFYQCPEMNGSAILAGTIIEPVIDFVGEKPDSVANSRATTANPILVAVETAATERK